MVVLSVWVVSRAGGLIYRQNMSEDLFVSNQNDYLVMASILQSVSAIVEQIIPSHHYGVLECIETQKINIHIKQTQTGTKFVFITKDEKCVKKKMKKFWELYINFSLKNISQIIDMPVNNKIFDKAVRKLCA